MMQVLSTIVTQTVGLCLLFGKLRSRYHFRSFVVVCSDKELLGKTSNMYRFTSYSVFHSSVYSF